MSDSRGYQLPELAELGPAPRATRGTGGPIVDNCGCATPPEPDEGGTAWDAPAAPAGSAAR